MVALFGKRTNGFLKTNNFLKYMAKRRSFGQKKEETNKHIFVGRTEQLRFFEENLKLGPDDADFTHIFNVYGQGGAGTTCAILIKPFLLKS